MALREDQPPTLPTRQDNGVLPDYMAPDDLENQLLGPKPEQPAGPPPQKVMVADASGGSTPDPGPPLPARDPRQEGPPLASPEPPVSGQQFKYVKPDDSRYADQEWLVMNYILTQGALPWLQAATDVAAGRVPPDQFDEVRKEHSLRTEEIVAQHPDFTQAAMKAAPFLMGLGFGIMKPAGTVAGTVARGVGAGAAAGAVQGFTGGDPNEPTLSRERAVGALEGAASGGVMGAAGAGAAAAGRGIVKGAKEVGRLRAQDRANREATDAADARRETARFRAQQKRKQALAQSARQEQLAASFEEFKKPPAEPSSAWKSVRAQFEENPGRIFNHFAETHHTPTLSELSQSTNLPEAVIAKKLSKLKLDLNSPEKIGLKREIDNVLEAWDAFKARPKKTPSRPSKATNVEQPQDFGYKPKSESVTQTPEEQPSIPYRGPALERAKKLRGLD